MIRARPPAPAQVPPLESGDRMTRHAFHRRFEMHPEIKKAELIEGVVYVPSPVRGKYHGRPASRMSHWLNTYRLAHAAEVETVLDSTLFLDEDNEPMPDLAMFRLGGSAGYDDGGWVVGAPDLVVEISASSASYDLHDKKNAYRRNGVQEYIVWRVFDDAIDWWELRAGDYVPLEPDANGVVESRAFPGLRLDVPAMLADDLARVLAALDAPA